MTRDEPGTEAVRDGLYAYYSVRTGLGYEYGVATANPTVCPSPDASEDFRHEWRDDLGGTAAEVCEKCGLIRRWAP
jgi:hypothetical protein